MTITLHLGEGRTINGSGVFRTTDGSTEMRMTTELNAAAFAKKKEASTAQPTSRPKIVQIEMILLDDAFYMKLPGLAQQTGKPWMKIDPNGDSAISKFFGMLAKKKREQADPAKMLQKVKEAGTITGTDHEKVDGQPTTHYSITIHMAKTLRSINDPQLKALLKKQLASMPDTYPMDLWINQNHLPVKVKVEQTLPKVGKATVDVRFSDWGKPVTISAPPASEVGPPPAMRHKQGGGH